MSAATIRKAVAPLEHWRALFDARWTSQDAIAALRRDALEDFLAAGFPTPCEEDWKYTNLRRLEMREFQPASAPKTAGPGQEDADAATLEAQWIANAGTRIVLVDGHWAPARSSSVAHPPGVTVLTLNQWCAHAPEAAASFLSQSRTLPAGTPHDAGAATIAFNSRQGPRPAIRASALEQLNLAFCEDGIVIDLAEDTQPDAPLYVVHQWSARKDTAGAMHMSHPRIIVRAARNSRCTLIEHFLGSDDGEYFTNAVTHIDLASGASLAHYRLQTEALRSFHIANIDVHVGANGRYACHDIALGASLGRVNLNVSLGGAGAHVALHGLLVPMGTQHLDAHTRVDHLVAHTSSEEDYRGVAGERGRGVFNGKVIVHPGAQKTDARQSSRNLLLSPTAQIDTKPELEIYADDVKCAHGATTGQLDAMALFYLRSRGVPEAEARALLIRAFAESILGRIETVALRSYLEERLDRLFALPHEVRS